MFRYDLAVVCGVPASLPAAALRQDDQTLPVDLQRARDQHEQYVQVLRELLPEVLVLPADELYPDCVFVEDAVVVCDGTAFITIPGHASRRGETVAMRSAMKKLGLNVVEMTDPGRMDGGDVLFTGREFFVGVSQRTNEAGLAQLANSFPKYPVTGVPVTGGLHLKSFMSMAGPDLISIGMSQPARKAADIIKSNGKFKYSFVQCPDDIAANCLYVNGHLIHVTKEAFPRSAGVYENLKVEGEKFALDASELNKVDGCFTCCSVLVKKSKQLLM